MVKTNTSDTDKNLKIGTVFTPKEWAGFAISESGLFKKWMKGASIFDPTMGTGHLLEALIDFGLEKGYAIHELPVNNLFGNELNSRYYKDALSNFREKYGLEMSESFRNEDIFDLAPEKFDVLFGNPPWQNFTDLPPGYKERTKLLFAEYGLIGNARDLLLGRSRIDIAALVIRKTIKDFLARNGEAWFFMPLSLLLNDGANEQFRNYRVKNTSYAPKKIFDFNKEGVFLSVSTRYGLVHFQRDREPVFPMTYVRLNKDQWEHFLAAPLHKREAPLSVYTEITGSPLSDFRPIRLPKSALPRQGINTSGANNVFFFKSCQKISENTCLVNGNIELPEKFVFPLLTSANFKDNHLKPEAWVLIPHSSDGRPLTPGELDSYPSLKGYLLSQYEKLINRKGTLINGWLRRERWWALLGVGPYNYAPYKIVWEAYGKKTFNPMLIEGHWQANQSLQAFIPFQSGSAAEKALKQLQNPAIEEYLLSLKMEGTMNWAQPGKIKKLIHFT
ncbi:MAG: SAM-dependent DNA methyltransferase [Marinilabilia sp.]